MKMSFPELLALLHLVLSVLVLIDLLKINTLFLNNELYFQVWRYFTNILFLGNLDLYQIFLLAFNYRIYISTFKYAFNEKSSQYFYFFILYSIYLNTIGYFFNSNYNYYLFNIGSVYFWGKFEHDNNFLFLSPEYFYM